VAIAQIGGGGDSSWLNPDVINLFSWHILPHMTPQEHSHTLSHVFPTLSRGVRERLVGFMVELGKEEEEVSGGVVVSTRQLMRLARRVVGMTTTQGEEEKAVRGLPHLIRETLMTRFASSQVQEEVEGAIRRAGFPLDSTTVKEEGLVEVKD